MEDQQDQPTPEELQEQAELRVKAEAERRRELVEWANYILYAKPGVTSKTEEEVVYAKNILFAHRAMMLENIAMSQTKTFSVINTLNNNMVQFFTALEVQQKAKGGIFTG